MAKGPTTEVSNTKLEFLIKVGETFCIKAENGEWEVPAGTYKSMLGAVSHCKSEMAKQARQRRRTLNINYVDDHERRAYVASENTKDSNK